MGKPTGFLEFERELPKKRYPQERINDYNEVDGAIDATPRLVSSQAEMRLGFFRITMLVCEDTDQKESL